MEHYLKANPIEPTALSRDFLAQIFPARHFGLHGGISFQVAVIRTRLTSRNFVGSASKRTTLW